MEDIALNQKTGCIDRFFQVSQNHSSVRTEVLAGITTFITIAYILILNPQILADPYVIMGEDVYKRQVSPNCINMELIRAISSGLLPSAMQQASVETERASSQDCKTNHLLVVI